MRPAAAAALLASVLGLLAGVPAASAQDPGTTPPPKKKRGEGGPVFSPPEQKGSDAPEKKPEKPPEPPKSEIEILMGRIEGWPSSDAKAAAERLVAAWSDAKPLLAAKLARPTGEGRSSAAAAWCFQRSADPDGLPALVAVIRDPRVYKWAGEVIEAVAALDPGGAKERIFPMLLVPSSLVVDRAARVLQPMLVPADVARLLELTASKSASTRRAALGLASELDYPAARAALSAALGDPAPEVSFGAAVTLGTRSDDALLADLNRLVREGDSRRGAYATVALVIAGERRPAPVLEGPTTAALLGSRGLRSGEMLLKTASALALADLGYQRPDPLVDPLIETEVVPALLEVVAGTHFFSDLPLLRSLVLDRLHRLCAGTDEVQVAPDWVSWWDSKKATFAARRALTNLPASTRGSLKVRAEGEAAGAATGTVFAASPADAPPAGGAGGRFILLSRDEADGLAAAVEASGLLGIPETTLLGEDKPVLEISVEAANRVRTVRFAAGVPPPASLAPLFQALASLREADRWQSYWDRRRSPNFAAFVESERAFWKDGKATAQEKAVHLTRLTVGALPDLPDADRLPAMESLRRDPALREALRPEDASVLASFAAVGERLSPQGEAALRILAAAGRTEGLSVIRARLEAAPEGRERSAASALMEESFASIPLPAVIDAAEGTAAVPVRCAAIRALGSRGGEGEERVPLTVRRATASESPELRAAGYQALGRLRTEDAATVLQYAAGNETDLGARCGALEGLGFLGGTKVVGALGKAASDPDPRVRASAVRGLGTCREPEALTYVLTALTSDADPAVREEADRAVKQTGGDRAREALRTLAMDRRQPAETRLRAIDGLGVLGAASSRSDLRTLLVDPDQDVADAAAFVLAWIRDGDAAPRLLDALKAGRSPARTLRSLELLSLESFRQGRAQEELAALYAGWFEMSRERGPRGWLAEALTTRGFSDETIKDFESGSNPRAAVPALLKAFGEKTWYLRRAANLELQKIAGASFGEVDPWTPEEGVVSLAEAWTAWWEGEKGARK
jgi:HEAT repeat protein